MKKDMAVKYPHSANLFQFCRKVLDHKFGGIRVIDQDVGQILGFDPADCSHWKKGKKNICLPKNTLIIPFWLVLPTCLTNSI